MPNNDSTKINELKGKRILITGHDLEQLEYRGIASYSKSLINILHAKGAEVWILSGFDPNIKGTRYKHIGDETLDLIRVSRILDSFESGSRPCFNEKIVNFLILRGYKQLISAISKIEKLLLYFSLYFRIRRYRYSSKDLTFLNLGNLIDNPNLRINRLGYIKKIEGVVIAKNIFETSQAIAHMSYRKPVGIEMDDFDIFICTSPLFIKPENNSKINFIQTIHDLIPLEYYKHGEDQVQFIHRLQACQEANRIYVSKTTQWKFSQYITNSCAYKKNRDSVSKSKRYELVVKQPPTLDQDSLLEIAEQNKTDYSPGCTLNSLNLEPFKYILFNSSIEPRKNLIYLLEAYKGSKVFNEHNIKICVTGRYEGKKDKYVKSLRALTEQMEGVVLSGYVNESEKLDIYLNTICLVSPSLVEGYGIPVLDACCLGIQVLASDCEAHREIYSQYDFDSYVSLLSLSDIRRWRSKFEAISSSYNNSDCKQEEKILERIRRYIKYSKMLHKDYENALSEIINQGN